MADKVLIKIKRQADPKSDPYWEEFELPYRRGMNVISSLMDIAANPVNREGKTTADMANGPVQRIQPWPEALALLEKLGAKNNHKCVSC